MKLPLFPLPSHIFPEGRMALRIFEPRYLRMIKQACANNTGFVICMINDEGEQNDNSYIYPIGTMCKVIDFDMLEDGLLGVTIEGIEFVELAQIEIEHDDLRNGECTPMTIGVCDISTQELDPLDVKLKETFERYPQVSRLYQTRPFDNPVWVLNRWLELLPISANNKQELLLKNDYRYVFTFLSQLIKQSTLN